uniref:Uncharacterized protein n=1 Tax=Mustela putorius furo TaxID=9669 RepID=M3YF85_MUSPF
MGGQTSGSRSRLESSGGSESVPCARPDGGCQEAWPGHRAVGGGACLSLSPAHRAQPSFTPRTSELGSCSVIDGPQLEWKVQIPGRQLKRHRAQWEVKPPTGIQQQKRPHTGQPAMADGVRPDRDWMVTESHGHGEVRRWREDSKATSS